nr:MAG TPA: hypothetical protein [Caudoviricetes sp.]
MRDDRKFLQILQKLPILPRLHGSVNLGVLFY